MINITTSPDTLSALATLSGFHWKIGHRILTLIGTGFLLGFFHVATGPDHLTALATLSANIGNYKAFSYGIRWGIGHSTGLAIVAATLIPLSTGNDVSHLYTPKYSFVFDFAFSEITHLS